MGSSPSSYPSSSRSEAPSSASLDESASTSEDVEAMRFSDLGVPGELVRVLADDGKVTAFPIQQDTLPDSLSGRDVLGRGRTGSGKTLAFAIPMVARLAGEDDGASAMREARRLHERGEGRSRALLPHPRALVLEPTRELANQVDEVIRPLARVYGMDTATVYGGVNQNGQVRALRGGADIVVACPGRLEDLLRQRLLSLESVEITVLDEADEMADMGFLPAVERLLEQVEPDGQHMMFSATLDHGVDHLVKRFLTDAKVHAVDSAESQVDTMTHHVFLVTQGNRHEVIRELASGRGRRILFTRTKFQAKNMARKLVQAGIPAVDLQGNLSQNQRDRHLAAFEDGRVNVLVATDVAARGLDVSDVELVVQTEPPADPKSFLHRSGRTARAGESGDVVTLVLPEQRRDARQLLRRAGIQVKPVAVTPQSEELTELVGEHAPVVDGWDLESSAPAGRGRGRGRRGGSGRDADRGGRRFAGRRDRPRRDRASGGRSDRFHGDEDRRGSSRDRTNAHAGEGSNEGIVQESGREGRDGRSYGDRRRDGRDGDRRGDRGNDRPYGNRAHEGRSRDGGFRGHGSDDGYRGGRGHRDDEGGRDRFGSDDSRGGFGGDRQGRGDRYDHRSNSGRDSRGGGSDWSGKRRHTGKRDSGWHDDGADRGGRAGEGRGFRGSSFRGSSSGRGLRSSRSDSSSRSGGHGSGGYRSDSRRFSRGR